MKSRAMKRRISLSIILLLGAVLLWTAVRIALAQPAMEKTITVDGLERHYRLFIPSKAEGPMPVVLALHGGRGNPAQMERYTRFDELAEKEGFAVAYPEAIDGNWNDGRGVQALRAQRENIDDIKFVRALLDDVAKQCKIDRSRIFASGISNGAFMSHRLAAEASDLVAAVAPVVGGMAPAIFEKFDPEFPVSILVIQGDSDPLVPIAGGGVAANLGPARGTLVPTADMLAKYVKRNGNQGKPVITTQDNDPNDGTTVEIHKYPFAPDGTKTELHLIKGGGHAWPGRPAYLSERTIGKASQEFSATDVIWHFFKACPPRARTPE
jgi:polyhydroxybutyrate depolymerase